MKAPTLDVDQAGWSMLPYARSRLLQLEQRRASTGAPFLHDRVLADGTTTIDITASAVSPKIRIRGQAPVRNVIFFFNAAENVHYAVGTDASGNVVERTRLTVGFTPLAIGISASGRARWALVTDAESRAAIDSPLTFHLYKITAAGATLYSTVYTPPSGWLCTTTNGYDSARRGSFFAVTDDKCLMVAAETYELRGYRPYADAVLSSYMNTNYRAVALYFSGSALSTQESTWVCVGGTVVPGAIPIPQTYTSVSPDCSRWSMVLNGFSAQESYSIRAEVHTTATGAVSVETAGPGFDPSFILADYPFNGVASDVNGFLTDTGIAYAYRASFVGRSPTVTFSQVQHAGVTLYAAAGGSGYASPRYLMVSPAGEVAFVSLESGAASVGLWLNGTMVDSTPYSSAGSSIWANLFAVSAGGEFFLYKTELIYGDVLVNPAPPFGAAELHVSTVTPIVDGEPELLRFTSSGSIVVDRAFDTFEFAAPVRNEAGQATGFASAGRIAVVRSTVDSVAGAVAAGAYGYGSLLFDSVLRRVI